MTRCNLPSLPCWLSACTSNIYFNMGMRPSERSRVTCGFEVSNTSTDPEVVCVSRKSHVSIVRSNWPLGSKLFSALPILSSDSMALKWMWYRLMSSAKTQLSGRLQVSVTDGCFELTAALRFFTIPGMNSCGACSEPTRECMAHSS